MNYTLFFHVGEIQLDTEIPEKHLSEVADSMTDWEEIANKFNLIASDVEEIKTKHPRKLKLQK